MTAKRCHCGEDCVREGRDPAEPCWGDVHPVDEIEADGESWYIHACSGHAQLVTATGSYEPEPAPQGCGVESRP